jgi:hypothetical protein
VSEHEDFLGKMPVPRPEDWPWIRAEINKIIDGHNGEVWSKWAEHGGTLRLWPRIGEEPDFMCDPDWPRQDE